MSNFVDEMESEERKGKRVFRFVIKHGMLLVAIAAIVLAGALGMLLRSANAREEKLEAQVSDLQDMYNILKKSHEELSDLTKEPVPVITSTTIKEELNSIAELVTQEYIYTNSDRSEEGKPWIFGGNQPFGDKSMLITYDGTVKAGVDLSKAVIDVNEDERSIKVILPKSTITSNEIPVENIVILEVKNGLFNKLDFEDYNKIIEAQKIKIEAKVLERGLLEKADKEAVSIVKGILSSLAEASNYKLEVSIEE